MRREPGQRVVGERDEPRSGKGRGAQVRRRRRQEADQRDQVLDLVGVEEAEALVDVGRDAARLERPLELAVRVARAEQDRDVAGRRRGAAAGVAIADRARRQQPRDLGGHGWAVASLSSATITPSGGSSWPAATAAAARPASSGK